MRARQPVRYLAGAAHHAAQPRYGPWPTSALPFAPDHPMEIGRLSAPIGRDKIPPPARQETLAPAQRRLKEEPAAGAPPVTADTQHRGGDPPLPFPTLLL
jgi:hypothetical protein